MRHLLVRDIQRLTRSLASRRLACNSIYSFTASDHHCSRSFNSSARRQVVRPYLLADIGEGITECQIINWFVKPGDRVEQFDRICEVQSDKASVEITSRFDGTIKALHYGTDDMAIVGQPLLDIDIEGDAAEGDDVLVEPAEQEAKPTKSDEAEEIIADDIQQTAQPQEPQVLQEVDGELRDPPSHSTRPSEKNAGLVSPAIRHMLKKLNIDVTDVKGTGKDGRVLKEDVQRYTAALSSTLVSTVSHTPTATPASISTASAEDRLVSLTATEKQMFKVMTRSLTIPHFLYTHAVDLTSLNRLRKHFNADKTLASALSGPSGSVAKLTPLPFIMKALSCAFLQFPTLNSHLDADTDANRPQLLIKASHNFGIAVDTPQGLLVPVVRDVQDHSVVSLAAEINRLSGLAKEGRLGVEDFKGATFTVSNIGSIGGGAVSPVIVAPMVGILGVGRVRDVPAFEKDERGGEKIVKREEVVLSWSADHRVLDGATVAKCAEVVKQVLENFGVLGTLLK